MPWTAPQVTTHPVGPWILPQASAWRQALAQELTGDGESGAVLAGPTLATWLRASGRSTSLHLAMATGAPEDGEPRAPVWLGLSSRAETEPAALRALRELETDLGALLDAWEWYAAPEPTVPDFVEGPALFLAAADGGAPGGGPAPLDFGLPAFSRCLRTLGKLPQRLGLHAIITPSVADQALVQAAEQAARQAVASDDRAFPWDANPLTEQALRLHDEVTASSVQLRLHGAEPVGRALRTWLEAALSADLGLELRFQPEPATLSLHGGRAFRLLELLGQRTGVDLEEDREREPGEPPF